MSWRIVVVLSCLIAWAWSCDRDRELQERPDSGRTTDPPENTVDAGTTPEAGQGTDVQAGTKLARFSSDATFQQFVKGLEEKQVRSMRARRGASKAMPAPTASAPAGQAAAAESSADSDADSAGGGESITNVQEAGVDEGGIIKVFGDYLVVLRRGRLFTVRIGSGEGQLQPVSMIDAFPPGSTARGSWYDEMLINRNTIIVVGFSYQARATELGIFNIDNNGLLSHRATYYLRSNDYYSSRNYASRLIGDTLIFYMPYRMFQTRWENGQARLEYTLPGMRRWTEGSSSSDDWNEVMTTTNIYQPIQESSLPVLHTVVSCDLSSPAMRCDARGVIGPHGRDFYVSSQAVYIWVHGGRGAPAHQDELGPDAVVYRMPLRGGDPGALRVSGVPTDQFSFKESDDAHLNVLLRAQGGGGGMWGAEVTSGDVALMRVPLSEFLEGVTTVGAERYTSLPRPQGHTFQNRFVGNHILYGTGSGWGRPTGNHSHSVFVHSYRGAGVTTTLSLPHGVDRLEVMGQAAVVIGTDGQNLHFTAVSLGENPQIAGRYIQQNAAQGELRSHGFFYRPVNEREGYLGLPIRSGGRPGYEHLVHGSAQVMFLHVQDYNFSRLGNLAASTSGSVNDNCLASCVDWYGNARPIFLRGRIIALLGYELVEGRVVGQQLTEVARTNFYRDQRRQTLAE